MAVTPAACLRKWQASAAGGIRLGTSAHGSVTVKDGPPGSFLSLTPGPLSAETMWTVRAVTLAHAVPYLQEKIVATSACFHPHLFSPRIGGQLRQHLTRYIGKNTPECRKYNGACQHMETNGKG